jgi:hypothetical protein
VSTALLFSPRPFTRGGASCETQHFVIGSNGLARWGKAVAARGSHTLMLCAPPGTVHAPVVTGDEEIQVVPRSCDRPDRRAGGEEATKCKPVVIDAGPIHPAEPPGGVDTTVVTADEEVQIVRRSRYR